MKHQDYLLTIATVVQLLIFLVVGVECAYAFLCACLAYWAIAHAIN